MTWLADRLIDHRGRTIIFFAVAIVGVFLWKAANGTPKLPPVETLLVVAAASFGMVSGIWLLLISILAKGPAYFGRVASEVEFALLAVVLTYMSLTTVYEAFQNLG